MKHILYLLVLVSSSIVYAEGLFLGPVKSDWPETEFRKTKNDFGGWLLVTPDTDWQQQWNTSPDTVPHFKTANKVNRQQELVILILFVNPKIDAKKYAKVLCDIKVTRPDHTTAINQKNIVCMDGELQGNPNYIRLSPTIIKFSGEPNDPLGLWVAEVTIRDKVRKTDLALKTHFELVKN